MLLTFALAVEMVSLGLATAASLTRSGQSIPRVVGTVAGLSLLLLPGTLAGTTLLRSLSPGILEAALSFGVAALLFLVTEELLVEAHEEPRTETPFATATFFLGVLLFLVLGMMD